MQEQERQERQEQQEVEEEEVLLLLQEVGRVEVNLCSLSTLGHLLGHSLPPHEEASLEKSGEDEDKKILWFVLAVFRVF